MIRCIPVDGSEAFEVENDAACILSVTRIMRGEPVIFDEQTSVGTVAIGPTNIALVGDRRVRIESWRERAERLEHENALLRLARDYCAVPWPVECLGVVEPSCDEFDRFEAERDAIEAKIVALGCSLAEAQNL